MAVLVSLADRLKQHVQAKCVKKLLLPQSCRVVQCHEKEVKWVLCLRFRTRALAHCHVVQHAVRVEVWLECVKQKLVEKVAKLVRVEVEKAVRRVQHHSKLLHTKWPTSAASKLLQSHLPRDAVGEVQKVKVAKK